MNDQTKTGSLNPDNARQGGGFLDDVDVTLQAVRYVHYDFQGKGKARLCLQLTFADGQFQYPGVSAHRLARGLHPLGGWPPRRRHQ